MREVPAAHIQVAVVKLNQASFFDTFPRFCRSSTKDMNSIEGKASHVVLEGMDDTIACPLQHDEQEQSTHYGKARSNGAHEIAPKRSLYFV